MISRPLDRLASWWPAALVGFATLLGNFIENVRILLS